MRMPKAQHILLLLLGAAALAGAKELTPENWEEETSGKTVFIKFLAPWCGHCKSMKPAWDKLMKKFDKKEGVLIADVDCTADGKDLCEEHGVEGFPTIKWGDPSALEDYEGGRDFKELEKFANKNLKPLCSPANIDLCEGEKKEMIEKFMALDAKDLEAQVEEKDAELKKLDEDFEAATKELQEKYESLEKTKEEGKTKIKEAGHAMMKAVLKHQKKAGEEKKGEL